MKIKTIILICGILPIATWAKTPLILLSIDGFAQHYIERYQPKTILSLIKQGTSAKALLPVYPSKTFPNHVSIITGRYPINHGILHNEFYHRDLGKVYQVGAGKDEPHWLTAEPLWHINEAQGNISAVYFWPESETPVNNKMPSYYYPYQHFTENQVRLQQIINWLRLPEDTRPNFISAYFASIDDAGHSYGEDSIQLRNAIKEFDQLLADFIQLLHQEFANQVNLVIVSDHGMTKINLEHVINWRDQIPQGVTVVNGSTQLYLYSEDKAQLQQSLEQFKQGQFQGQNKRYNVYTFPNYPEHWHLNQEHAAVPDAIIDALPSYIFSKGQGAVDPATHGYDPRLSAALNAIFIAVGPAFAPNQVINAFENIQVLPILTRALGLKDLDNIDGNYKIAEQIVKTN
ncbi:Predicted pyrophosphatase or phosphodiesterase, AlkP superfamily [Colwellia chukchiensis]|uniref:Predicted pyrophosphatase or phosphodiesterase, AlkP superfamily n=1 Tax=Colwellia chukchiensis TaxID=641665 RepID=A0A1H7MSV6_9GAMM|nr:ectonucleotide pyrophosphatase/phosphodiesterase [Colwellia chukchiensis]SEL14446.1 Predicted pyrophosphatase or phosphodiesterase, AlkP superfamily [Colwellia chukchiensis]